MNWSWLFRHNFKTITTTTSIMPDEPFQDAFEDVVIVDFIGFVSKKPTPIHWSIRKVRMQFYPWLVISSNSCIEKEIMVISLSCFRISEFDGNSSFIIIFINCEDFSFLECSPESSQLKKTNEFHRNFRVVFCGKVNNILWNPDLTKGSRSKIKFSNPILLIISKGTKIDTRAEEEKVRLVSY